VHRQAGRRQKPDRRTETGKVILLPVPQHKGRSVLAGRPFSVIPLAYGNAQYRIQG
jgi:hypothetical protein